MTIGDGAAEGARASVAEHLSSAPNVTSRDTVHLSPLLSHWRPRGGQKKAGLAPTRDDPSVRPSPLTNYSCLCPPAPQST